MKRPRATTRAPLTRERIVAAAISILTREGPDNLTMRRLGQELGVQAMALYNHFDDRETILDAMADHVFGDIPLPSPRGHWTKRLRALATSVRAVALEQPQVFRVAMSRPTKPARSLPVMDATLAALRDAGLNEQQRFTAYQTLAVYIKGFLLWELDQLCMTNAAALPKELLAQFPQVLAIGPQFAKSDPNALYRAGVDLLIEGIAARAT